MLSQEIEKEIQQENKVILNFTLRQVVCLGAAVVCSVLIAVFLELDFEIAVYPCFVIGGVCFAFGWIKQDGLPMEKILLKKLQTCLYKNNVRVYKIKNSYTVMLNREYDRRRRIDGRDKKLKKLMKREEKAKRKNLKKSRLRRIE